MLETKTRKQGNSTVIGIPSQLNVEVNAVYFASKDKHGNILLVPKLEDPYADKLPHMSWHEETEWEELWSPQGREVSDD